jgi:hypothetical protein
MHFQASIINPHQPIVALETAILNSTSRGLGKIVVGLKISQSFRHEVSLLCRDCLSQLCLWYDDRQPDGEW